jgi:hypothetical protein
MKKENLSAYQFLLLYSALSIYKEKTRFIYNKELEKKLANFYNVYTFNILFSNIKLRETNKTLSLNLDEAFAFAYEKELLTEVLSSDNNVSIINFSNDLASDIINSFDNSIINLMNDLIDMSNENKEISFASKKHTRKLSK